MGSFYNTDLSDTCTTAGRNIIAVSAITNELMYGWYHYYVFEAHMKLINVVTHEDCDKLSNEFDLPLKSTDEIIKHMLGNHYNGYYKYDELKVRIDKLSDNQKRVLYMKNNLQEFMKLPKVDKLFRDILNIVVTDNMITTYDDGAVIMNPFSQNNVKDYIEVLQNYTSMLLFGMYYYEGDYIDGVYQETMVDIIRNLDRRKIGNMD